MKIATAKGECSQAIPGPETEVVELDGRTLQSNLCSTLPALRDNPPYLTNAHSLVWFSQRGLAVIEKKTRAIGEIICIKNVNGPVIGC